MRAERKSAFNSIKIVLGLGLLSFIMVLLNGFSVNAAKDRGIFTSGNFTYEEAYGTLSLREYRGPSVSHITIPGKLDGKIVNDIGNTKGGIFKNAKSIKSITIEEGVTDISGMAFDGCANLEEVHLPASLRDIENHDIAPFEGCKSLKKITVAAGNPNFYAKDGVLFQKQYKALFYYPSGKMQKSYRVPEGIKVIQRFGSNPYLEKVILPRSAVRIGHLCFANVFNLKSIVASDGIKKIDGKEPFRKNSKVKVIAYKNSFLWNYAKKEGIKVSSRLVKEPAAVKAEKTKAGIQLNWKSNEDASGYMIYRSSGNGKFTKAGQVPKSSRERWTDKRAVKGKTYDYKVRAYRDLGKTRIYSKDSQTVHIKN